MLHMNTMARLSILLLSIALLAGSAYVARADDGVDEKDVVVLTSSNFDDVIKKHKFVLVEFYAPWCGHCKRLTPNYAKAATTLKANKDLDVVLGKVDATVEKDLGGKFKVSGYPTLKWFVDGGEPQEYNGPREAEGIVAWINKKTGPPATLIDAADKLTALEASNSAIVVFFGKKLNGDDYEAFKSVAQKTEDVAFVETTTAAVASVAGLAKPGVAIIKNFKGEERATAAYTGKLTVAALSEWVGAERLPLVLEFNPANNKAIFQSGPKQQLFYWGGAADVSKDSATFALYKTVAAQFKGKLVFAFVDHTSSTAEPVTNFFGFKDAKPPQIAGLWLEKNRKYKFVEELTEANLKAFAQAVIDGTAHVEYKSAALPNPPKDGNVAIVVGKNVDDIVFDESKDVLLEVYAPWCGHCKKLDPAYQELAKKLAKVDSIVIAKMDGTENEHPSVEVKGFPTLFFKPAGAGKGSELQPYEGGREVNDFIKFLQEKAKKPFTLPDEPTSEEEEAEEAELAKEAAGEAADAKDAKDEL